MTADSAPAPGLRERKKARTRATIQRQALRLFRERGYEATTIDQVAQAAEVAHTTLLRYFPTKEDLVVSDTQDPLLFASFRAQPAELAPLEALRAAIRSTLGDLPAEALAENRERTLLVLTIPALRGAAFENFVATMHTTAEVLEERLGRAPGDPAVRTVSAALFGVFLDLTMRWVQDESLDLLTEIDTALDTLKQNLLLQA